MAEPTRNAQFTWTRTEPGVYVAQDGETTIRREATTFAYPQGASNPRWRLYFPGQARYVSQRATLAEAKADAERRVRKGGE